MISSQQIARVQASLTDAKNRDINYCRVFCSLRVRVSFRAFSQYAISGKTNAPTPTVNTSNYSISHSIASFVFLKQIVDGGGGGAAKRLSVIAVVLFDVLQFYARDTLCKLGIFVS